MSSQQNTDVFLTPSKRRGTSHSCVVPFGKELPKTRRWALDLWLERAGSDALSLVNAHRYFLMFDLRDIRIWMGNHGKMIFSMKERWALLNVEIKQRNLTPSAECWWFLLQCRAVQVLSIKPYAQ